MNKRLDKAIVVIKMSPNALRYFKEAAKLGGFTNVQTFLIGAGALYSRAIMLKAEQQEEKLRDGNPPTVDELKDE